MQHTSTSIHQHVEALMCHRLMILAVLSLMFAALIKLDARVNSAVHQAYNQGFSWIGMYMHHEHPRHGIDSMAVSRFPTISSGNG